MTDQVLSNVLTINRLLSHFTTQNVDTIRSCVSNQLDCQTEAQFLSKILNICYKHELLSNESIKTIKNEATKIGYEQKITTSDRYTAQTVCQYVENQYQDPLSGLNSNIIDYLGEYFTNKESYNFGCANRQLYIETKKSSYIKMRLQRKQDNKKRFYFRYIYFNDMIRSEPDNQSNDMWDVGGIPESKYMNKLHWYKNTKFSQVFDYWEKEHNIKKENQLVYLVTERQNHTMRPNRQLFKQRQLLRNQRWRKPKPKWPVNENDSIYSDQLKTFFQRRKWTVVSTICMLFDKRAVHKMKNSSKDKDEQKEADKEKVKEILTIDEKESDNDHEDHHEDMKIQTDTRWINDNQALLILKYFDVFEHKVIFIDAIICEKDCRLNDILNHFLNNIIVKSKNDSIVKLRQLMENIKSELSFTVHEEENAMNGKFNDLTKKLNESVKDAGLMYGDILVIGLNAYINVEWFCSEHHK